MKTHRRIEDRTCVPGVGYEIVCSAGVQRDLAGIPLRAVLVYPYIPGTRGANAARIELSYKDSAGRELSRMFTGRSLKEVGLSYKDGVFLWDVGVLVGDNTVGVPQLGWNGVKAPWDCEVVAAFKHAGDDFMWTVLVESQETNHHARQFVVWDWNGEMRSLGTGNYVPVSGQRDTDMPYRDAMQKAFDVFESRRKRFT